MTNTFYSENSNSLFDGSHAVIIGIVTGLYIGVKTCKNLYGAFVNYSWKYETRKNCCKSEDGLGRKEFTKGLKLSLIRDNRGHVFSTEAGQNWFLGAKLNIFMYKAQMYMK